MDKNNMTQGSPWKHIIKFALPVLLGSLLQQLYNTVDAIIVGNFSSQDALSAVGTTSTMTFFFLAIATGLSAGNGVVISQHYGAQNEKEVRKSASTGIIFLMFLGLVTAIIGIVFANPLFKYLLSVPAEILSLTVKYFMIYSAGLIFQYGYNIFSSILRAVGDSKATLYFLFISSALNVVLDYVFVAIFNWGVVGAAVATDIAQLGSLIAAYVYMRKKFEIFRFEIKDYVWDMNAAKKTVQIGMPISIQLIVVSLGLTFIQKAVNQFGKIMTASFTVGQRIEQYINLPSNALQTTLATYVGQNIGANKLNRVEKGTKQGVIISLLTTVAISSLIWIFAGNIAGLFGLNSEALVYCRPHIQTVALINIVLSSYIPLFGAFQGMGHSEFPAIVVTFALTVRVFVTYFFRYSSFLGYTIIWWNGLFGFGIGFIIAWSYYLSGKWKRNKKLNYTN